MRIMILSYTMSRADGVNVIKEYFEPSSDTFDSKLQRMVIQSVMIPGVVYVRDNIHHW